jgi:hypothetical protein
VYRAGKVNGIKKEKYANDVVCVMKKLACDIIQSGLSSLLCLIVDKYAFLQDEAFGFGFFDAQEL